MSERFRPAGKEPLHIEPEAAGLTYAGLDIVTLEAGGSRRISTGPDEVAILPLEGSGTVDVDGISFPLSGRRDVFCGPSDFVYAPLGSDVNIASEHGGRFALCRAKAAERIEPYRVDGTEIAVEVRGGGPATRQINNFLAAGVNDASRLIAVEVITPEGGWSSYPPHKHDEFTENEVALEEIYYFEIVDQGFGFFTAYTSDASVRDTVTVRSGDVYLVPDGYHGPAAAAPGYHMYYLNVMAGPGDGRVWRFCDDPAYAHIRGELEALPPDPRLPMLTNQ